MDKLTETIAIPKGYQEVRSAAKDVTFTRQDIPWLPADTESKKVNLAHITLEDGTQFYLGSALVHGTLQKEAGRLGRQGQESQEKANQTFYKQLKSFIQQTYQNPDVPKVQHPRSRRSIYYAKSLSGERTYFMEFDKLEGKRVIIRLAACSKSGQDKVLRVIAEH